MWFIKNLGHRSHIGFLDLNSPKMLNVDFRVKQLRQSHVHKIFNGTGPSYLSKQIIKVSDVHHHFTRGSTENFIVHSVNGVAATTFYYKIKDGTLYPQMSNKRAFSMVSNLLQIMDSDTYAYYQYAFSSSICTLGLCPLLIAFLDLTNRTPLEISLRVYMGYPGLFQHSNICLYVILHLNNTFCLHSYLTLLDPFRDAGV